MRLLRALLPVLLLSSVAHAQADHIPRGYGSTFLDVTDPTWILSGKLQLHRSGSALQIHGTDDSTTEIWPGYSQVMAGGALGGTWRMQAQGDGTLMQFMPSDGFAIPFNFVFGSFTNLSGGQPDAVMRAGWNVGAGAGAVTSGPGIFDSWERRWEQLLGAFQQERHIQWRDPLGAEWRPISIIGQESSLPGPAPHIGLFLNGTSIVLGSGRDNNAPASLSINGTTTTLTSPSARRALVLDDTGAAQVALTNTDGTHTASLVMSPNGTVAINTATGATGRWFTHDGNALQLELDGTTAQLWSGDGTTFVQVTNGQTALYVNSTPILLAQPSQAFFPHLIYQQTDGVGANTRIDQITAVLLRNTIDANSGTTQQFSPCFTVAGRVWTGSVSSPSDWCVQAQGIVGSTRGRLVFAYSTDDANGSTAAAVNSDGGFEAVYQQTDDSGSLPTCDVTKRGQTRTVYGGAGVTDVTSQCLKSAADTYNWIVVKDGG